MTLGLKAFLLSPLKFDWFGSQLSMRLFSAPLDYFFFISLGETSKPEGRMDYYGEEEKAVAEMILN